MRSAKNARPRLTLRALLRDGARRLEAAAVSLGHGTTNANDEAAWLGMHAFGVSFEKLIASLNRAVSPEHVDRFNALVSDRIRTRKPAAYLTHQAWLGDHAFYVDERVIVPRSFIAELLRDDLKPWIGSRDCIARALDLCTGSGCLAILLTLSFPCATVEAADIATDALEVARRNVRDYKLQQRIKLTHSDLYSALGTRRYDLIVSNPPYVSDAAMRRLPREYRNEPRVALAGGRDGLHFVRRIVSAAPRHLKKGGLLVVEVGHNRGRVERAFPQLPLTWAETSGGNDCVFLITREALLAASPAQSARASRGVASPRRRGASSPDRASAAAAARPHRSVRA